MKNTTKTYAEALAHSLLKNLEERGEVRKADRIVSMAEDLFLKKSGGRKIILETARPMDTKDLRAAFVKKEDMVQERVNPKLIAGVRIIIDNEKQLDFSLAKKLENMF